MAAMINKCHDDLCNKHKKIRTDLRSYAEKNFDVNKASGKVIKIFKDIVKEHGSVNSPKIDGGKRMTFNIEDTAKNLKSSFEQNQATAFVTFGKKELALLKKRGKVATRLSKAFKYVDKKTSGYHVASAVGVISEGRMRPYLFGPPSDESASIKTINKYRPNQTLNNAMVLPYLSTYDPIWFVDLLRKHVHNKKVLFVGKKEVCKSALVKNAFNVKTFLIAPEDNVYEFIVDNNKYFEIASQQYDIIICADLDGYSSIIAHDLWQRGFRVNFLDVGHIADAMCGSDNCPWFELIGDTYLENYQAAFLPARSDIVMITHGQEKITKRCIESVVKHTSNYRMIWVDNGSGDASIDAVKESGVYLEDCDIIKNNTNIGYAAAANKAFKKSFIDCSADWIVLLDNDVIVTPNWLLNLISSAISNNFDAVCPLMSDGNILSLENFRSSIKSLPEFTNESIDERATILNSQYGTNAVDTLTGSISCCAIRRDLVEQIGLFDDQLFFYGEDADYFNRIARMGKRIGISLGTYVHHDNGTTTTAMGSKWVTEHKRKSKLYLSDKWAGAPRLEQQK